MTYTVYHRRAVFFPWLPMDDYGTAAEARRFLERYLVAGEYRVGPTGTRPTMTDGPERVVAPPDPKGRPRDRERIEPIPARLVRDPIRTGRRFIGDP